MNEKLYVHQRNFDQSFWWKNVYIFPVQHEPPFHIFSLFPIFQVNPHIKINEKKKKSILQFFTLL